MTTGIRSSAISIESELSNREENAVGSDGLVVAVLTGAGLPPLGFSPVLAPPFRFAVVDKDGLVLFHSSPRRATYENIYT